MEINIITFGKIAEFISPQRISLSDLSDTDALKAYLERKFPQLSSIKYLIALDKHVIQVNSVIKNNSTVAIMPPFSGG
nr:MoaD/ThiS family protein [Pedobacter panaciterrae]